MEKEEKKVGTCEAIYNKETHTWGPDMEPLRVYWTDTFDMFLPRPYGMELQLSIWYRAKTLRLISDVKNTLHEVGVSIGPS